MSLWTYVKGKFTIRFATEYGVKEDDEAPSYLMKDPLDICEVMKNAPRITGSEHGYVYSLNITTQAPCKSIEDDYIYYEAKIKIKGNLRDREFEETDQEVRNFIKYLKEETGYETKFVKGKIKVSNRPFDNFDWSDDEGYKRQIYDLGEKTEKDNKYILQHW